MERTVASPLAGGGFACCSDGTCNDVDEDTCIAFGGTWNAPCLCDGPDGHGYPPNPEACDWVDPSDGSQPYMDTCFCILTLGNCGIEPPNPYELCCPTETGGDGTVVCCNGDEPNYCQKECPECCKIENEDGDWISKVDKLVPGGSCTTFQLRVPCGEQCGVNDGCGRSPCWFMELEDCEP